VFAWTGKTLPFLLPFKSSMVTVESIPRFHAKKICIMPTFYIYAFVVILTIILCNGNVLCFLQGSNLMLV
jgi:hypothetical protein